MEKFDCQFYLAINEDGAFVVCADEEDALSKLGEDHGGYHTQVYEITLKVAGARPLVISADVPEPKGEPAELEVKVA